MINGTDATEEMRNYNGSVSDVKQVTVNGKTYVRYNMGGYSYAGTYYKRVINVGDSSGQMTAKSFTSQLKEIIKNWYFIIRIMAIVGMMSVLVYIGIRILISSTASQKSKYKQLIGDWVVGMVLLFTMHYIMVFSNIFVDNLTDLLRNINPLGQTALIEDENGKIEEELEKYDIKCVDKQQEITNEAIVYKDPKTKQIEWNTDLMGHMRILVQYNKGTEETYIGYTIMYIVMVIYTATFCFTYIRRVIYMAFLTIIAPLVALTYPIDKANDGSAQGFNYWFKEYIFNLLLQPLHLLIYTILVSSAAELATSNWIYALVAIGFVASAEKIVRQMFNFSKASTPGAFAGPAGAALAMSGMRWLFGHGPRGPQGGRGNGAAGKLGGGNSEDSGIISSGDDDKKIKVSKQLEGLMGNVPGGNSKESGTTRGGTNSSTNSTKNKSLLDDMRESEEQESLIPTEEQQSMWDNDIRFQDFNDPDSGKSQYSADEYEQILRDSGYSEEQIADEMAGYPGYGGSQQPDELDPDNIRTTEIGDNPEDEQNVDVDDVVEDDEDSEESKTKYGWGAALADSFDIYKDGMKNKIVNGITSITPDKIGAAGAKLAGGVIGAAAFGTIGVAAGVASGDGSKAAQYGAAAIAGGAKLGAGAGGSIYDKLTVDGVAESFEKARLGPDQYRAKKARENQMKKARDEATIKYIQEKEGISRATAKEKAKDYAEAYMEQGIDDPKDWVNIEKMTKQHIVNADGSLRKEKYSREDAIAAYQIRKRAGIDSKDKQKSLEKIASDFNLDVKDPRVEFYYRTAKALDDIYAK